MPGGLAGAEGEPGHALHPDHQQRRLGHAHRTSTRPTTCRPRPRSSTTAVSALISDLKANGLLRQDAGRDVRRVRPHGGPDHGAGGRDHWPQQFAFFAGGGVKGGTVDRADRRTGARHGRLRLVAESLRLSGGYRGDDLLGARASTGPRCATTTRWAAASNTCRRPARSRSCRFTNSGGSDG